MNINPGRIVPLSILVLCLLLCLLSCRKLDFTTVTKSVVEGVFQEDISTIKVAVNFFDLSPDAHADYGICYSFINPLPEISEGKVSRGSLSGPKRDTIIVSGLTPGALVYVRGFVMSGGTPQYSLNAEQIRLLRLPQASTLAATNVLTNTATLTGQAIANGLKTGVVFEYGTSPLYGQLIKAVPDSVSGMTSTAVSVNIGSLLPNTRYHYRLRAANKDGVVFGKDTSFVTQGLLLPQVTTSDPFDVTSSGANAGGNVVSAGGSPVTVRGICWSTRENPDISDNHILSGAGLGAFNITISGLEPQTTYYAKAFASNSQGTGYGLQVSFTTSAPPLAVLITLPVTEISPFSAKSGGNITSDAGLTIIRRGVCWSLSPDPTTNDFFTDDGSGPGTYISYLTGLQPYTTYYVRAYATNEAGTAYAEQRVFTTLAVNRPQVITLDVSDITQTTARSGGNVISDGGAPVTARGVCWSTNTLPTIDDMYTADGQGTGTFASVLSGLLFNTTYHIRAYAINIAGVAYGEEFIFTTQACGIPIVDPRDGVVYNTVQIGSQCWFSQNLAWLPVVSPASFGSQDSPVYYVYGYQGSSVTSAKATANYQDYGVLYNWSAAVGACPEGWHLPSDLEWTVLIDFLGGFIEAGGKMKESGTVYWNAPNAGATNQSGFSARGGGNRTYNGLFELNKVYGFWWSSSQSSQENAFIREISNADPFITQDSSQKNHGFSVRCLMD